MRTGWHVAGGVAAALVVFIAIEAQQAEPRRIATAPAFDARRLTAHPTRDWITNGGNVFNQRYSPLTLLDRDNVKDLKALWRTQHGHGREPEQLGPSADPASRRHALRHQRRQRRVRARRRHGRDSLDLPRHSRSARRRADAAGSSRGVALGEGKIFVGLIDARSSRSISARARWSGRSEAERWQDGFSITSAPLYYDGMVITGFTGGEMGEPRPRQGVRREGRQARSGRSTRCRAPASSGTTRGRSDSDAWQYGGAPVWQTPAVDPELGLVYFSTGNPGPDLHGGVRAGDNLFTVSIVAIDAKTGKYRWHFQQVHHDIWDYDSPNPVVLFDAPVERRDAQGLVQVSKTGWAYILDRETGEPLIGIEDRAGAAGAAAGDGRDAAVSRSATRSCRSRSTFRRRRERAAERAASINDGKIFTPFWTDRSS